MAKEIEKYFVKRLQTYLLEYLNDFSQNNVAKFSLGISSNIRLENLSIKKQALLNFSLPMYIIDGKISSITVNMPLNYKSQQSEMIIEGIDLTVCAISEISVQGLNKNQKGDETLKKQKLKIWEEQMIKYFEQLSPPNWIQKIVDGIYNNMSVTVKSFNLKFQNTSIFGTETVLRMKADFAMKATDCNFQQKFNSDLKNSYKQIEIKKISISLRGHNFKYQQSKKEEQYILYPIDIVAKLTINKDNEQMQKPLKDISIKFESPIIFQINKDWKNYLLKLNELFKNLEIIQDNYHMRPLCDVKSNYDQWWKYLINAVITNQKNHKLDLGLSSRRLVLMKRYIELYKRKQNIIIVPWLSTWTLQDEQKFQQCEKQLSLKDLLKYREWSFQEIRIEARRYFHSSKDGQHKQSVKPILEIWTNTINNQNSFKDHQKKFDDDIPIELEDDEKINLYEILERDKTQVLTSFLKGQNNNPDQVKLKLSLEIHSVFLLLIENRIQSQIIYSPNNTQIFKLCQCSLCYSKKVITRKNSESSRKSKRVQADKSSIYDVISEQKLQNKDDLSFHTAKAMDSFTSDLRDLDEDRQFISESIENEPQNKNNQQKQNLETQKNQKIILMISLIGICCQLEIYQDNRIKTSNQNPFIITDIRILSLGMIPTLLAEKQDKISQVVPEEIQKAKNTMKKRFSEFISEIFEITIQNQQVFLNSEACFLSLIEFLSQNEMQNIAAFLIEFEKDKNCFQDFSNKNYEQYDSFFNETEQDFFIHMTVDQQQRTAWKQIQHTIKAKKAESNKSWKQYQTSANKHQYIQELHSRIVELIKKKLFVQFLEEYGDQILPLCIQYMKDKFGTHQLSQNTLNKIANLKLSVQLDGSKTEFEIKQTGDKNKGNPNNPILEQQPNPQQIQQFQYKLDILPFQFFLTTKSIASLMDFIENTSVNQLSQSQLFITQNQKLLECILKSKPLSSDLRKKSTTFSLQIHEKFKIRVLSDQLANITKTELQLQIEQLHAETTDIEKLLQNIRNSESLNKQHKHYSAFIMRISRIFITHKYYAPDLNNSKEELRENQYQQEEQSAGRNRQTIQFLNKEVKKVILSTSLSLLVLNSLIENHALLTDQKIYLQIPYFKLELSDSLVCFTELLTILMKQREQEEHQPQKFIMSQDSLLRAELISLYTDHTHEECKHCILKYKKSIRIINVLFGVINPEQMNNNEYQSIWFNVMDKLIIQHQENKGLMISFVSANRFAQQTSNQTIIWIPIIVFTKDLGYFKDLNTIHCSSSTVLKNGCDKFSNIEQQPSSKRDEINYILIQPSYEVNPIEVWRKLDDKFIFYGRKLENELFNTNFDINQESEFDREIVSSEFKTPNQDKLYLLAYYFNPLRKNLIKEQEKQYKEKNMKIKLYFQLQKIWARFIDQFAACTVLTTVKNLTYIGMIVNNIYNLMYQENIKVKEQKISFDKQNPIEILEDMMISIYVQSLYYASNQSFFRLNSMRIMFQLELINEDFVVQSEIFYKRNSNSLGNANENHFLPLRNRKTIMNQQNMLSDGESIMKCAAFIFNFNKVTVVDVKLINIKKKSLNEITFSIDNISITISPLDKLNKEILLTMPDKDKSNKSKQMVAITMNIHFYNSNPQIDINVESGKIQLSQQTVKDLLIAVNSFYLINIQEQVALTKFLKTSIYKEQLYSKQKELLPYDLFKKLPNTEKKSNNYIINYTIYFSMESLKIILQNMEKNFFSFEFLVIELEKKRGQDILVKLSEIKMEPLDHRINLNLIQQYSQQQKMTFKIEGRVIYIENIKFIMISKFMNELKSFKNKINQILQQSRKELYQQDQDKDKANEQLEIDAFDQEIREQIPFRIILRNSQVKIPASSISDDYVEFFFSNCEILLEKVKKEIQIPKFRNTVDKIDMIVIDSEEENEIGQVFLDKVKICLKNVRSQYFIKKCHKLKKKDEKIPKLPELFDANEINLLIQIPYYPSNKTDKKDKKEWFMKDHMEIILKELNMKLDLGRMLLVKQYIDSNLIEKSDLFDFQVKGLEKIQISLRVDTLKAEKQVYGQQSQQFANEQEQFIKSKKIKQQFTLSIPNQSERQSQNQNDDQSPLKYDSS